MTGNQLLNQEGPANPHSAEGAQLAPTPSCGVSFSWRCGHHLAGQDTLQACSALSCRSAVPRKEGGKEGRKPMHLLRNSHCV